jgi:oxygen-dependent protoporphyrinogen oxidase
MQRVIVIGGGISGLACARHIADARPDADVLVLEAGDRTGGVIGTDTSDGSLCEHGPTGFMNHHPSTLALAERLGLRDEVLVACAGMRRRWVFCRGRLHRFPDSPATFLTSDLLSVRARLRVLMEPWVPPAPAGTEETVGGFARRRLGREAAELLVDPLVSGVYAADPDRLSLPAVLPQMAALDGAGDGRGRGQSVLGHLLRTRRGAANQTAAAPPAVARNRYVSFRRGLGRLVDALADSLGPAVRTRSPVAALYRDGEGWRVRVEGAAGGELSADAVVSATPAAAARRYLGPLDAALDELCARIPYAPLAVVALGYGPDDVPHPLDGFGYLVPSREGERVLGVLWATSIFPAHRRGGGRALLRVIAGGMRDTAICGYDDETLLAGARAHLRQALGITRDPDYWRVFRHPVGLPQYELGHLTRLERAEAALAALPGLYLAGNALRGVGINACTALAERVAGAVVAYLTALRQRRAVHSPAA